MPPARQMRSAPAFKRQPGNLPNKSINTPPPSSGALVPANRPGGKAFRPPDPGRRGQQRNATSNNQLSTRQAWMQARNPKQLQLASQQPLGSGRSNNQRQNHETPTSFDQFINLCVANFQKTWESGAGPIAKSRTTGLTKDVVVRGKTYKFRQAFLSDVGKFEADFPKFVEKKSEAQIPNRIVEALQKYINEDIYESNGMVDDIILNMIGTNVGMKSVVSASMANLKRRGELDIDELILVAPSILLSAKVDDGLKAWLKKQMKINNRWITELPNDRNWELVTEVHPELTYKIDEMFGLREEKAYDSELHIL